DLISNSDTFEDLDFGGPVALECEHEIDLTITRDARLDGFLVWLNLETVEGEVIDILAHEHCWLPVYLPAFDPGLVVQPGDRIRATVSRLLCENGLNPDYIVKGSVATADGITHFFEYHAHHFRHSYRETRFYDRLFRDDTVPVAAAGPG